MLFVNDPGLRWVLVTLPLAGPLVPPLGEEPLQVILVAMLFCPQLYVPEPISALDPPGRGGTTQCIDIVIDTGGYITCAKALWEALIIMAAARKRVLT
jgi:hypothetical protein